MVEDKVRELLVTEGIIVYTDDLNEEIQVDSLQFISIIVQIEETFDIIVPDEYLTNTLFSTLGDYVGLVKQLIKV